MSANSRCEYPSTVLLSAIVSMATLAADQPLRDMQIAMRAFSSTITSVSPYATKPLKFARKSSPNIRSHFPSASYTRTRPLLRSATYNSGTPLRMSMNIAWGQSKAPASLSSPDIVDRFSQPLAERCPDVLRSHP